MNEDTVAIVCIFGLPIAGWIIISTFRFLERMEMIKRGMVPPPRMSRREMRWARYGAPPPGPAPGVAWQGQPVAPPPIDDGADPQRALFKGIQLTAIGFALFLGLSFIGGVPGSPGFAPGPWLLGGLIPMFVGIAQIAIAILMGAQFPLAGPRATWLPPPTGRAPGPPPPPPPGAQPGREQPGRSRFEELSRPAPPPDRQ